MSKVVCDETLCSGCLACVIACIDQHYDETKTDAVSPRIYEKWSSERTGLVRYKTRNCQHCEDAPCIDACPLNVLERTENGYVAAVHIEQCIGCKKCATVCPHDVPGFDTEGKLVKCDGCAVRVAHGLEPACVRACNTGALRVAE